LLKRPPEAEYNIIIQHKEKKFRRGSALILSVNKEIINTNSGGPLILILATDEQKILDPLPPKTE
jgi:hypothetical protein